MALQETEINPGGVSFLYSMLAGNEPQREADLSAYYPGSQYPTRITKIISSTGDDSLYLLTSTQNAEVTPESTINRISLLSYAPQAGIKELYRFDIDIKADSAADRRYMAISTLSFGRSETSTLVVDIAQGTIISQLDNLRPICQPFVWSLDSNQLVYTRSDMERCPLTNPNQPINQVISYDIFTRQSTVLVEHANPFFFLSPGG